MDVTGPPLMLLEAHFQGVCVYRELPLLLPTLPQGTVAPEDVLTEMPLQPHRGFQGRLLSAIPTLDQTLGDLLISGHEKTAAKTPGPTFPPLSLHWIPSEQQASWI